MINSIKQFLGLSFSLAVSEFKLRNEGSYLGIFWYLLNPVLMFILLMAVFSANLGTGIPSYPIYLLIGIIMFNFFQKTTIESTKIIMQHNAMIKSIKFPHNALIGSIVLKTLFSHFFEIIVLAVFLVLFGVPLSGLIFYPLILVFFCLFV